MSPRHEDFDAEGVDATIRELNKITRGVGMSAEPVVPPRHPSAEKMAWCLEKIVTDMREPGLALDVLVSEIQDWLSIAGYDVPLRSYDDRARPALPAPPDLRAKAWKKLTEEYEMVVMALDRGDFDWQKERKDVLHQLSTALKMWRLGAALPAPEPPQKCPTCGGKGFAGGNPYPCPNCNGSGAALPAEHAPPDTLESLILWLNETDWWDNSTTEMAGAILKRLGGSRPALAGSPEPEWHVTPGITQFGWEIYRTENGSITTREHYESENTAVAMCAVRNAFARRGT